MSARGREAPASPAPAASPEAALPEQRRASASLAHGRRWRILYAQFLRYRWRFLAGVALLLATNGLALSIPWLLKYAVDAVQRGEPSRRIAAIAAGIGAVAILQALVRTLSRIAILGSSRHIVYDLRNRFFARLVTLPASFFDRYRTGDLMSRAVNDLLLIRSFFGPGILNLANTVLSWVGAVVLMAAIDPRLTLWSLIPYPFVLVAMNRLSRALYLQSTGAQEQLAALSSRAQENLSGIAQVKAYDLAAQEIADFNELALDLRRRNLRLARIRGAVVPLMGSVGGIGTFLVLVLGTRHLISGRLTLGSFVAFNAYLASLAWPTIAMGWILNVFQRSQGALERISEVLDAPSPRGLEAALSAWTPDRARAGPPQDASTRARLTTDGSPPPEAGRVLPPHPDLEVEHLSFTYDGAVRPALADVSLRVPAGGLLGIVGTVGSGKTTLVRLLARMYPVAPGSIRLGGIDLDEVDERSLREMVAVVPQESFLFSMTLAENIALGRPDAAREAVEAAGRAAGLEPDLQDLPNGYDTLVGERGYTLSGGQRQRVALARALLVEPAILLLDDPFASIDASTEQAIIGELASRASMTRVLAGHRVSAVQDADEILVLDAGRVVERGRHGALLALGGTYARLFERQQAEREIERS